MAAPNPDKTGPHSPSQLPLGGSTAAERPAGLLGQLFSGWIGFAIWLSCFIGWLFFLGYQVTYQRPEPIPSTGSLNPLPSRAQLTLADGVWSVRINPKGLPIVAEVVAGDGSTSGKQNQLVIEDLDSALQEVAPDNPSEQESVDWLVPVIKVSAPTGLQEGQKERWKVAPLPADPARPKGSLGRIYPSTPFNRRLLESWWSKGT